MENLPAPQTPYSQIIVFASNDDKTRIFSQRVTTCPKYGIVEKRWINFKALYAGHCDWIARDIAARSQRNNNRVTKKAA